MSTHSFVVMVVMNEGDVVFIVVTSLKGTLE